MCTFPICKILNYTCTEYSIFVALPITLRFTEYRGTAWTGLPERERERERGWRHGRERERGPVTAAIEVLGGNCPYIGM